MRSGPLDSPSDKTRPRGRNGRPAGILLGAILLVYGSLLALGRLQVRGVEFSLSNGPYYAYVVWVLLLPAIHALVPSDAVPRTTRGRSFRIAAGLALALANAVIILQTDLELRRRAGPVIEGVCMRALAKKPKARPSTAEEFAGELTAWLAGPAAT